MEAKATPVDYKVTIMLNPAEVDQVLAEISVLAGCTALQKLARAINRSVIELGETVVEK